MAKIVPRDFRTESTLNEREKKENFGKYWFINLTSKVRSVLEQVLKEQINEDMEVKEILDTVQ